MRKFQNALIALVVLFPTLAHAQHNVAQWVQLMPGGGGEARVVTTSESCPHIWIDGKISMMRERAAPDTKFSMHLCAITVPQGTKKLFVLEPQDEKSNADLQRVVDLPLPSAAPSRILMFGDTGCRITSNYVQACNDPKQWPFPLITAQAAMLKPDLVIHVGDYLYRETPCPSGNASCDGSPSGDNWPAWAADFFTPAEPLLRAAPWVFVRGNHEDCARGGPGWLRLLGPLAFDPAAPCDAHLAPYVVPLGAMNLVVMDDADAPDTSIEYDLLPEYRSDFAALPTIAKQPLWLAFHRPIWGAVSGPMGLAVGGNRTMIAALDRPQVLDGVALMLAGHIHTFEALNYAGHAPPQLVAGFGGGNLDTTPADLSSAHLSGQLVESGLSLPGFGFLLMTREGEGWRIDVHRVDGAIEEICHFAQRRIDCVKP
jgi:hypothetical protein